MSPASMQGCKLLIDACLSDRVIAKALCMVDYNAESVTEKFGPSITDPILIQWLGLQRGIWVTADENARRKHATEINNAGIHVLWVRRDRNMGMSKREQLLLILWVIDDILETAGASRAPAQFLAYFSGKRPKWEKL